MPGAVRPQREARMGAMPDTMQPAPLPSVYQLRVVVHGVSPLIWLQLLIPADTTIADLHAVLQIAFGWTCHFQKCAANLSEVGCKWRARLSVVGSEQVCGGAVSGDGAVL